MKDILKELATIREGYFMFEHTPHSNPSDQFVKEGMDWVKKIVSV